ncbi:MAG: DUF6279 family lipoprotein [Cellvibrionaceae bacterium]
MKTLKSFLLLCITITIFSCGHSENYIKKMYLELDREIATDYKKYAEFSFEQEEKIDIIAQDMLLWHRKEKLPEIRQLFTAIREELSSTGSLNTSLLNESINTLNNPFTFTASDDISMAFAQFAFTVSDAQIIQIIEAVKYEEKEATTLLENSSIAQQTTQIKKRIRSIFKSLGVRLSKEILNDIDATLSQRVDITPQQIIANTDWNNHFVEILEQRDNVTQKQFTERFVKHWEKSDKIYKNADLATWLTNQQIVVQSLEKIIETLDSDEKATLHKRLGNYINVIDELMIQP